MARDRATRISKFLARHLRHAPEDLGLELDAQGWADVDALLAASARAGLVIGRADLDAAVHAPGKRRYAYDASGARVRALQGHSIPVDLGLQPVAPPATLFHGTHPGALAAIRAEGLRPMGRHHVHLSPDERTARQVGGRRGRPVVLEIDARAMASDGHEFLLTDNGVWLTCAVPARHLRVADDG
jgi:putative RNA 2'-phosphotransferase